MGKCARMGAAVSRRKLTLGNDEVTVETDSSLRRVLDLLDLSMLGVGSTLGLGAYVLAGAVARTSAGPAVTVSFLIAAVASSFAGICYAEFAARVPQAGSAYIYSYVTVGELCAFFIGWNLILEYIIGAASVARGLSNYVDALANEVMSKWLKEKIPTGVPWLSPYPDLLSASVLIVVSLLLAWGVKESSLINKVFTVLNILTVSAVVSVGVFYADFNNWSLDPEDAPEKDSRGHTVQPGSGGFMPFGISGIMAGAARCFYGFVGFDCVATTGEEAKNPKRDIPLAIFISLFIILLAYFSTACVLTLMLPYYLQDVSAPLPFVFEQKQLNSMKIVVTFGAIFALCTNIIGCLFPLPRVVFSMARDRLVFSQLACVSSRTKTPVVAILLGGVISALMAMLFDINHLIEMMSIGTLMAYTVVALCVVIIRYQVPSKPEPDGVDEADSYSGRFCARLFNLNRVETPTNFSANLCSVMIAVYIVTCLVVCCVQVVLEDPLVEGTHWCVALITLLLILLAGLILLLRQQPMASTKDLFFQVPLVPLFPCLSMLINIYLMFKLDFHTWIRFFVWLFLGIMVYSCYGVWHSKEAHRGRSSNNVGELATAQENRKNNHL